MTEGAADHYILFVVAGTTYALPSRDVAHVEMVEQVTSVPNAPSFVEGVVFSRGQVVPAINMRVRFGFPRAALDLRTRLLVVRTRGRTVGLLVDACREFMTIPTGRIVPPGDAFDGIGAEYLEGIAMMGERLIVVLTLDALMTTTGPVVVAPDSVTGEIDGNPQA